MFKRDVKSRTRLILGLQYDPYCPPKLYHLPRQNSTSSSCSSSSSSSDQCLPSPSSSTHSTSLPSVPSSPTPSKNDVFDKVKHLTPYLIQAPNLLKSVSNAVTDAMEDEEGIRRPPSIDDLPTDLQTVDITAFKRLLTYQPMVMDPRLFR